MVSDTFEFIERECQITSSQENTLLNTPFARDQQPIFTNNDDFDDDNVNDTWPVSSDDDDDAVTLPDETVIFCSPPPSPQPDDITAGSISDELGFQGERKRPREKELTPASPPVPAEKKLKVWSGDEVAGGGGKVFDTEEVNVSDDEDDEYDDGVDTDVIEEDEEKLSGEAMKCVNQVLRVLSERNKGKKGNGEDEEVDFLETAKRRGCVFPEPRWLRLN